MLAIAIVRLTPRELVAQGSDEAWFKLMMRLEAQNQATASERIQKVLNQRPTNVLRRVTFIEHEVNLVLNAIRQE